MENMGGDGNANTEAQRGWRLQQWPLLSKIFPIFFPSDCQGTVLNVNVFINIAMVQDKLGEDRIAGMVDKGVPESMGLQVGGGLWKLSWKAICRRGDPRLWATKVKGARHIQRHHRRQKNVE